MSQSARSLIIKLAVIILAGTLLGACECMQLYTPPGEDPPEPYDHCDDEEDDAEPEMPEPGPPAFDITRTFSEPSMTYATWDYLAVFTAIDTQIGTDREVARTIYIARPFASDATPAPLMVNGQLVHGSKPVIEYGYLSALVVWRGPDGLGFVRVDPQGQALDSEVTFIPARVDAYTHVDVVYNGWAYLITWDDAPTGSIMLAAVNTSGELVHEQPIMLRNFANTNSSLAGPPRLGAGGANTGVAVWLEDTATGTHAMYMYLDSSGAPVQPGAMTLATHVGALSDAVTFGDALVAVLLSDERGGEASPQLVTFDTADRTMSLQTMDTPIEPGKPRVDATAFDALVSNGSELITMRYSISNGVLESLNIFALGTLTDSAWKSVAGSSRPNWSVAAGAGTVAAIYEVQGSGLGARLSRFDPLVTWQGPVVVASNFSLDIDGK